MGPLPGLLTMPANGQALSRVFLKQALKGAEVIDAGDKFLSIREIKKFRLRGIL
jgi:hypothetical protein